MHSSSGDGRDDGVYDADCGRGERPPATLRRSREPPTRQSPASSVVFFDARVFASSAHPAAMRWAAAPGELDPDSHGRLPGCCSAGRKRAALRPRLRATISRLFLAHWHGPDNHCRLSMLWSSPRLMWSASLPQPRHFGACCSAWHLPLALTLTALRICSQMDGRRSLRSEVDQTTRASVSRSSTGSCAGRHYARAHRAGCWGNLRFDLGSREGGRRREVGHASILGWT